MAEQQCKQINKMENKNYKKVNLTSSNLNAETLDKLRKIIPDVFLENRIDWDKLSAVLGYKVDDRVEKFGFTWAGKIEAIKNVLIPSRATLEPAKEEGIKFDESENIFIEGDNLEVLKLLQRAYFEKIKMIYIDPPYNTGGDFVYKDNFVAPLKGYLEQTGQVDGDGNKLQANRETNGRYHSDWLSMMYPRLKLAWNLLRDDGVIFISIDDNEVHHLRMLMDEIFGEENFIGEFIWNSRQNVDSRALTGVSIDHEYVLCYTKNDGTKIMGRGIDKDKYKNPDNDPRGDWMSSPMDGIATKDKRPNLHYPITNLETKITYYPNPNNGWRFQKSTVDALIAEKRIIWPKDSSSKPRFKRYLNELKSQFTNFSTILKTDYTLQGTRELREIMGLETVKFPKPVDLIKQLVLQGCADGEGIILDFFAGAGATAHAVMSLNVEDGGKRKYICVQLPEGIDVESEAYKAGYKTIADVAKERIRRVSNYLQEEVKHNITLRNFNRDTGMLGKDDDMETLCDFDGGFKVFKLDKSNYLENNFEFDPEISEEENKAAFLKYLNKARQVKLFEKTQELDVVFENIIKEGLSLNSKIQKTKIAESAVYQITDGEKQLLICLENKIALDAVKEFRKVEYKGKIFICLDNALDDTAKANLALNVELKTI